VARAHNVVTLPSHANLLAGRLPHEHGIRDNSGFRFPAKLPTLATLLRREGYRTGAFVSAFVLDSRFGLDRGFDVYDDTLPGGAGRGAFAIPERPASETLAAALRWLDAAEDAPSFLFLHLYEPHAPYEPPEPFATRFRDRPYLGEVAAVDAALAPLLERLRADPQESVVVLTSDHGEGLGDHGEATHGVFAYEEALRVPLVIHAPGLLEPAVVEQPVRHVDVLPTLLQLLGVEAPAELSGRSLLPLAVGRVVPPGDTYFEALSPSLERGWAPLRGVVSRELKYVDLPLPELYDLERDPGEERNLAAERPQDLERLASRLGTYGSARAGERLDEDAESVERLRALGYAATGEGAASTRRVWGPDDDPKRLIRLERREAEILRLVGDGEYQAARALCLESLAERPDMSLTWTQLLSIERALGRLDAAAEAGRRALALRPDDPATAALLAGTLIDAGRAEAARELLSPYLAGDPDADLLNAEGMALARLGRDAEALAAFERARRADPGGALALVNAGTLHLMRGDSEAAARAFEEAVAADPAAAGAHNGLGVIAAGAGRREEAVGHWRRAVEADPGDYRTLFNLGATLLQLGRSAEARPVLEAYLRRAPDETEAEDVARVRAWLSRLE
jgi:arylsulfatase A-like enzyme/Flp pilus assembly protein TadD